MRQALPFAAVCVLLCLAVSAMADSQIGAPSNVTEEQPSTVQIFATDAAGELVWDSMDALQHEQRQQQYSSSTTAASATAAVPPLSTMSTKSEVLVTACSDNQCMLVLMPHQAVTLKQEQVAAYW
jgi:hypothetical protein